jgi:hypothetical protein
MQVQEKKAFKQHEHFVNDQYMQKWIHIAEQDAARRKAIEEMQKQKKIEVKDFLRMQMGDNGLQDGSVAGDG